MTPRDCKSVLISWAAWVSDGRPIPFNAYPPKSIINRFREAEAYTPPGSRPLWHGKLGSYWLANVDRLLRELPEKRQLILLYAHLPARGTDAARAEDLGLTVAVINSTRKMARKVLQGL